MWVPSSSINWGAIKRSSQLSGLEIKLTFERQLKLVFENAIETSDFSRHVRNVLEYYNIMTRARLRFRGRYPLFC